MVLVGVGPRGVAGPWHVLLGGGADLGPDRGVGVMLTFGVRPGPRPHGDAAADEQQRRKDRSEGGAGIVDHAGEQRAEAGEREEPERARDSRGPLAACEGVDGELRAALGIVTVDRRSVHDLRRSRR